MAKQEIEIANGHHQALILGENDQNLKLLEETFGIEIFPRGNRLTFAGTEDKLTSVVRFIEELQEILTGGEKLEPKDIRMLIHAAANNGETSVKKLHQHEAGKTRMGQRIAPKNENQKRYLDAIDRNDVVFGWGPAGTGKTYLAMAMAVSALLEKRVKRIILTRPAVEAGEKLGFLPGDLTEKVNPYLRPLLDALDDMLEMDKVHAYLEKGIIEIAPIAFMRGRSLNQAFIILDEAQNTTTAQMKMFLTRIGFGTKAVVNGDVTQIDLPKGTSSGLIQALDILNGINGIESVQFKREDVVRNPLIQKIIDAYERKT